MLKGNFPVIPTMFAGDGSLDLESQRKVIQLALESGADSLVFPRLANAYNFLATSEQSDLIALLAEEVNGRVSPLSGAHNF